MTDILFGIIFYSFIALTFATLFDLIILIIVGIFGKDVALKKTLAKFLMYGILGLVILFLVGLGVCSNMSLNLGR